MSSLTTPSDPGSAQTELQTHHKLRYLSFGGGVQSTAIALMIAKEPEKVQAAIGHLPDFAVFADTGAEPPDVYAHIEELIASGIFDHMPLAIVRSSIYPIHKHPLGRTMPPYYLDTGGPREGLGLRQCTDRLKIAPINTYLRWRLGIERFSSRYPIAAWTGISIDEASRMRAGRPLNFENVYPLVEMGMDRLACSNYAARWGFNPPKSRCLMCPYVRDWASVKRNEPDVFRDAVRFDHELRRSPPTGLGGIPYLHRSLRPLDEAVSDQGHLWEGFADRDADWDNECSGSCGV